MYNKVVSNHNPYFIEVKTLHIFNLHVDIAAFINMPWKNLDILLHRFFQIIKLLHLAELL